jgi:hypothetical protein
MENYFIFEMLMKNIWEDVRRIIELFTQKIVTNLSKIGMGLGSGIRKTYSGSRIQGSKRHRIPITVRSSVEHINILHFSVFRIRDNLVRFHTSD